MQALHIKTTCDNWDLILPCNFSSTFSIGSSYYHLHKLYMRKYFWELRFEIGLFFWSFIQLTSLRHTKTSSTHINTFENWNLGLAYFKSTVGYKYDFFLLVTIYTIFMIHNTFEIWHSRWVCYTYNNDLLTWGNAFGIWDLRLSCY